MGDQRRDVTEFGGVGLQKFTPRWDAVEKIGNAYGRARSKAGWFNTDEFASREFHACAFGFAGVASFEKQARDSSDGGKRFSAETQRGDGEQIVGGAKFAGGVAFEREKSVIVSHAVAVVDDANHP